VIELLGWTVVGAAGSIMLTQAVGWAGSRTVAIAHTFTPYLAMAMVPVTIAALSTQRIGLAIVGAVIGFGGAVLARSIAGAARPATPVAGERLRIAALNLLYTNGRVGAVAVDLASRDIDVIMFSEYTPAHQRVLLQSSLADLFPHRTDRSEAGGIGIAVWSKSPVVVAPHPDTRNYSLDVMVATDVGPTRVIAVHPPTPVADFHEWRRDLAKIAALGLVPLSPDGGVPTAIVGDFNACFWHPSFRAVLAGGYTDAHAAVGRWFPRFVRLDHALVTEQLVVESVDDFDVAGSDHRGFVVTLTRAQ
jgi:endonuclease/exonuclease/phosphatase (EEP) superfamily protein YafD